MRTLGRATLPLAAVGAAMVAAAVLPAVGASAQTSARTPHPSSIAAPLPADATGAARTAAAPHALTTRHATHVVRPARPRVAPANAHPAPTTKSTATARPTIRPTATATASPTRSAQHPAAKPVHHSAPVSGPTGWAGLNAAIARIPTYRAGQARWVISSRYGHWGTADWYHATMYIAPDVPADQLFNVVVHEWSHELSVLDYDGNVAAATAAMNRAFGGTGLVGAERAADCMARLQGATWTHYTTCTDQSWRRLAAKLVAGHQL